MKGALHLIIPANNEAAYIGACLEAILGQEDPMASVDAIVVANACTDDTAGEVRRRVEAFVARGWRLRCLETATPGKLNAINEAEAMLGTGPCRIFLDADVICDPPLLGQLCQALNTDAPRYATGTLAVAHTRSWSTRRYAEVWTRLPFMRGGAVGAGLFAVNAAGRARWGRFPDIIADDTFARLHFAPEERIETSARYHWPMIEGLGNLVRVRRRQDAGMRQMAQLYPELMRNEGKSRLGVTGLLRLALAAPVGLALYMGVQAAVRGRSSGTDWVRGR